VSIAGIIATVGTGVKDLLVIIDETLKEEQKEWNWKIKLKKAFFVILTAYATTVAAMIPLWNAGAGLLRGLALTTIVGLTVGVFITRPAFASFVEKLLEE
jgi:preprotein translocase subunit SecD